MVDLHLSLWAPKKITRFLLWIVFFLALMSIIGQVSKYFLGHGSLLGFVRLFYVDLENNVPTWYSSITLLLASLILAAIAYAKKIEKDPYRYHWAVLSLLFFFLSIDEDASFHECLIEPLKSLGQVSAFFYYAWVIPGIVLVLLFGLFYLRFLLQLPSRTVFLFFFAGFVYILGAVVVEMISGYQASRYGEKNFTYSLIITLEEILEMGGIIIFIQALIEYLQVTVSVIHLKIGDQKTLPESSHDGC